MLDIKELRQTIASPHPACPSFALVHKMVYYWFSLPGCGTFLPYTH